MEGPSEAPSPLEPYHQLYTKAFSKEKYSAHLTNATRKEAKKVMQVVDQEQFIGLLDETKSSKNYGPIRSSDENWSNRFKKMGF